MIPIPTEATFRSGPPIPRSSLETFSQALGGRRSAETLQRVAMREHVLLIASLAGPLD